MNQPFLRKAKLADLPTLLEFEQGIITTERPMDPSLRPGYINYYDLKALILQDKSEVLVVEQDGQIVGSGYALIKDAKPYLHHDIYAYLGFMYVLPSHRKQGINKMILEGLKNWSKEQGLSEMRLEVYADNPIAIKAYEKAGFSANMVTMRMDIRTL